MKGIQYTRSARDKGIDAAYDNTWFQYKYNLHNLRGVQSAIVQLSRAISEDSEKNAILILDETRISRSRLEHEWNSLKNIFESSVFSRLGILVFSEDYLQEHLGNTSESIIQTAIDIQKKLSIEASDRKQKSKVDAHFEILRVLLIQWFRRTGPIPIQELTDKTGFSYPTIAKSLEKLENHLYRHTDRSVEIRSFPRDEWFKLQSSASDNRNSKGFVANRPKSIEQLLERLQEQKDQKVAIGGIIAARTYMTGINMLGVPRLDITVHRWDTSRISHLLRRLDPGLREVERGELPQVALHQLYRKESFFKIGLEMNIADEMDCLMDLQEARLDGQAAELLDYLIKRARS